jgi:hypothetical protein
MNMAKASYFIAKTRSGVELNGQGLSPDRILASSGVIQVTEVEKVKGSI